MKLIVNADDFGYSPGVNYGILDAHHQGILTSATMMMNMPGTDHACIISKHAPDLGIGVHFVLTTGFPLTNGASLKGENGRFLTQQQFFKRELNAKEIQDEFQAQLSKFLKAGLQPTHFDSHHHVHRQPIVWEILKEIAEGLSIPVRNPMVASLPDQEKVLTSVFSSSFYGEKLTKEDFIRILNDMADTEILEIMCHPGYVDEQLLENSSYHKQRAYETSVLIDVKLKEWIQKNEIMLCHYGHVRKL
ncbi:chitin disaccharide deacetylase [Metabacillus sp. RGM 3146]|uniref:chitin disaccharide deacetylase n=1 Tax=Metabacillus sp. RGM 3146 TaxID=3401092 RepID=UPI003B9AA537